MSYNPDRYTVSYRYDNPSPAGPYKGRASSLARYAKGDAIRAPFGAATVTACRSLASQIEAAKQRERVMDRAPSMGEVAPGPSLVHSETAYGRTTTLPFAIKVF